MEEFKVGQYITTRDFYGVYKIVNIKKYDYGIELELDDGSLLPISNKNTWGSPAKTATVLDYLRILPADKLIKIYENTLSRHDFCIYSIIHTGKGCPLSGKDSCRKGMFSFLEQPITDELIEFFKTGNTKYVIDGNFVESIKKE